MRNEDVMRIATQLEWDATIQWKLSAWCFDFHRKTRSGVPFCFTVTSPNEEDCQTVADEVFSLAYSIGPSACAEEWMIQTGTVAPSRYHQAVADMEDIRQRVQQLAFCLSVGSLALAPLLGESC